MNSRNVSLFCYFYMRLSLIALRSSSFFYLLTLNKLVIFMSLSKYSLDIIYMAKQRTPGQLVLIYVYKISYIFLIYFTLSINLFLILLKSHLLNQNSYRIRTTLNSVSRNVYLRKNVKALYIQHTIKEPV